MIGSKVSNEKIDQVCMTLLFMGPVRRWALRLPVSTITQVLREVPALRMENDVLNRENSKLRLELTKAQAPTLDMERSLIQWQVRAQNAECVMHLLRNWIYGKGWLTSRMPKPVYRAFERWCNEVTPPVVPQEHDRR